MKFVYPTFVIFAGILILSKNTDAAACTQSQLQGQFGKFRVTGGGGNYAPGSNQVVSYDHPTGSSVTSLTGISILPNNANSPVYNVLINSGSPATFSQSSNNGGSVDLNLPSGFPVGSYVFRLSLGTTTGTCTLDSPVFTSTGQSSNQCTIGQSECNGLTTFRNCVTSPSGNVFGGPNISCNGGTSCVQSGSTAVCTFQTGSCTLDQYRCSGSGFQQCQATANGNQYGVVQPCGTGTTCQQTGNTIQCNRLQCTAGQRRCSSTSQFQVCNGSNVFGAAQNCPAGTGCTGAGLCTSGSGSGSCPTLGYMNCASSTTWQQCTQGANGNVLTSPQTCPPGTTCQTYQTNYILCNV